VRGVEFVSASHAVIDALNDPDNPPLIPQNRGLRSLRVTFTKTLVKASVVTGAAAPPENPKKFSFLVRGPAARFPNGYVPGKITFPAPNIAQFDIEASDAEIFPAGDYRLTLFGVADPTPGIARPAIIAADLGKLDGKPSTLPSGDGTPGDNFDCKFGVA